MGGRGGDTGTDGRKARTDEEMTPFPVLAAWQATSASVYLASLLTDLIRPHFYVAFAKQ